MKKEKMNRSELWVAYSEKSIKQKAAGYKSACTKALANATSKTQRAEIAKHYQKRIDAMIAECEMHNSKVVRHNAAVKANETRKAAKGNGKYCMCVSTNVSKRSK